ncbi:MAG: sulfatase-like hydrolase/transferase [Pseudomonadota bacterium]
MTKVSRRGLIAGAAVLGSAGAGLHLSRLEANGSRGVNKDAPIPRARRDLNLLILMVDQERAWDTLPGDLDLPNHHRVANQGTSFTNMNVTSPLCTPSRSVFWTGQHVQHTGVQDNTNVPLIGRPLNPAIPTLGHMLREAGFYTAYKGKWHLHELPKDDEWEGMPSRDRALEEYGYSDYGWGPELIDSQHGWKYDGRIAADAAEWLTSKAPTLGTPWALTVSFVNPHDIMFFDATGSQASTRIQNQVPGPVLPPPDDPIYQFDEGADLPRNFPASTRRNRIAAHADYDQYMDYFYGRMPHENADAWTRFSQYYYNCIRDVDRHLGTVLDALEATGEADRTIVVLISDHGEMGGVHGLRQKGPWMYRENLAVPFVVSHPDADSPRENNGVVSAIDFTPTMLGLVGLEQRPVRNRFTQMRGTDVSDDIVNPSTDRSREDKGALVTYSVSHHLDPEFAKGTFQQWAVTPPENGTRRKRLPDLSARGFMRGLVTDNYKFARYFSPRQHHRPETLAELTSQNDLELFDLRNDPGETANLVATNHVSPDALLSLNAKLNALIDEEIGIDDGRDLPGPGFIWRA